MVTLLEKELQQADDRIKSLMDELNMDTIDGAGSAVARAKMEREVLHKLLKEQKLRRRRTLFAMENGLLLFAIAMFGVLGAFVTYVITGYLAASPTWEELGSDMAVMVLLIVMTSVSTVLYTQHYRHKING